MTKTSIAPARRRLAGLRRSASTLVLAAAVVAAAPHAFAASGDAEGAVTVPDITLPQVGDRDRDAQKASAEPTGSVDPAPQPAEPTQAASPAEPTKPEQQQAAPVAPSPADGLRAAGPIGTAFADLLSGQGPSVGLKLSATDRATLLAFYAGRHGAPLWLDAGRPTPKAEAAKARVAAAADDGLDPSHFRFPDAPGNPDDAAAVALADVQFSATVLAFAREAWGGRVSPATVSPSISARPDPFDSGAALASLDSATDVAAALDGFNPQHPQFQALRKHLIEARAGGREDQPRHQQIAFGKLLQPGDDDARVPALRERLGLPGAPDDTYFDTELADAVIAFQRQAKIGVSGIVNRSTIRALNADARPKDDVSLLQVNMERWRWLPRDLGAKHVFVDLANYELHVVQDGRPVYDTRVIIGKSTNQTPLLSSAINQIVVNPYWNVPVSIAVKELSQGSLRGFEVVDSRGKVVDPSSIDWSHIRDSKMRIRQPPGERNALGHIKFLFPNSHAVYLHDTPKRDLFANSERSLSHGCVRVDKPLEFADALSGDQGYDGDRLKKMIGGKERGVPLSKTIPVHLAYFTAWADDAGRLETRKDIYGLDSRVAAALRGEKLPPLPVETLPKIVKVKPKTPAPEAQTASAPLPQQVLPRPGPASWLARIFGDSRY
jgi:L,D-transpeptidase YcbB